MASLICTVRDCRLPLARQDRRMHCANGHSFDVASAGYVNLLQPQERRSKQPGDSAVAVAARRRLHDRGVSAPSLRAIAKMIQASADDIVADAGCGDGFYLGSLAQETGFSAHGIDISVPAITAAARRYPACQWVVANADRFVPYADGSFSIVLSVTARMNGPEFARILRPDGRLLVAIPAPDDLIEVRGTGRDRVASTIETFSGHFKLLEHKRVTSASDLDAEAIQDIRHSIYRPLGREVDVVTQVTFSLDLLLFAPEPVIKGPGAIIV
ncbi:MAG: putative RNA methyltransferase [Bryobacteraceae bacterium]